MSLGVFILSIFAWGFDERWSESYTRPCWALLALAAAIHILENK